MILLHRYILTHFFRNLGLILASFISIYLLIDFFEKIDNFLEKGKSFALIGQYFLLNIPFIIDMMSPVCILLAGVVTLGVLNHSNELIALIKQLVGEENPKKPLSDSQITDILGKQGIVVARRTIAKYRESLQIPPATQRKSL